MDRNTLIGLLLIMGMLLAYQLLVPTPEQPKPGKPQELSSRNQRKDQPKPAVPLDSTAARAAFGSFANAATGTAQDIVVENPDVKITFSSQGGRVKQVLLKKYKTFDQQPLVLIDEAHTKFVLEIPTPTGKVDLGQLYFTPNLASRSIDAKNQATQVSFSLRTAAGQLVEQTYTLPGTGYQLDYALRVNGLPVNQSARFYWQQQVPRTENDLTDNRLKSVVNYYFTSDTFDGLSEDATGTQEAALEEPVRWLSFKQKYFVSGFVSKNAPLTGVKVKATSHPENPGDAIKTLEAEAQIPAEALATGKGQFTWYFGPNDYQAVNKVTEGFDRNVYLGYALVKPINRYVFVPLFQFLGSFIANYGVLIIVLVLLIKAALTPLTYKSYVSMAKMRVLQPELNALREKIGEDDPTKMQQEQMKLYQQVGVNPLSGCIPQLLTLPILMSVFFLFPNLIELRQQNFLWSNDLSSFDSVLNLPFAIPFYGQHVSLFALLMTASSIGFAYYNNQMTPDSPGPVNMKALGYIMPVAFLFVMNSFPAGLSWYYFVSNMVTIGQQITIRRFVDEGKIKAVLEENRKKFSEGKVKKSKFSEYLQKQLQAAEEMKKQQDAQVPKKGKK
jgi:YidC/Oxa1 family membrane protein insertase